MIIIQFCCHFHHTEHEICMAYLVLIMFVPLNIICPFPNSPSLGNHHFTAFMSWAFLESTCE